METVAAFAVGAALLVGLAGTIVVRLPGVPLSWTASIVWASIDGSTIAWVAVGVATLLAVVNYFVQHRLAGGDWADLAVADRSWIIGAGVGIAGLLLARLPGLIFGFIGGTYMAERRRLTAQGIARNAADKPPAALGGSNAGRRAPVGGPETRRTTVLSRATLVEFVTAAAIGAAWLFAFAG
jgi:uncharacterized protein YqgC (DUF456 family)